MPNLPLPLIQTHHRRSSIAFRFVGAAALILTALAPQALAGSVTAPTVTESTATSGLTTPINQSARTYMEYLDASQFSSITTPVLITGIQFRLATGFNSGVTGTTWPASDLTFTDYTIQMSQASTADTTAGDLESSASFSSNQNALTAVTVRTGAMTIAAGSFANSLTGVNAFGPTISFTVPYVYVPGTSLTYLISESGYGTTTVTQAAFASFGNPSSPTAFTGDALVSTAGAVATVPTGYTQPLIVQFQYTPVVTPEPGAVTGLLIGGALLGAAVVRRRSA